MQKGVEGPDRVVFCDECLWCAPFQIHGMSEEFSFFGPPLKGSIAAVKFLAYGGKSRNIENAD